MCQPKRTNDPDNPRPTPRKVIANMTQPLPLGTKMRYIATNMWTRVAKMQSCCGHPGQPGC